MDVYLTDTQLSAHRRFASCDAMSGKIVFDRLARPPARLCSGRAEGGCAASELVERFCAIQVGAKTLVFPPV